MQTAVLLHNIRSAHNVGSVFRTADGAGVSKVYISGYSPIPIDRFGNARKDLHKVALNAESSFRGNSRKIRYAIISKLREEGWRIVGVEQDERAVDYRTFTSDQPVLFIFGRSSRYLSCSAQTLRRSRRNSYARQKRITQRFRCGGNYFVLGTRIEKPPHGRRTAFAHFFGAKSCCSAMTSLAITARSVPTIFSLRLPVRRSNSSAER